jgi:hypothetical protein
MLRSNLPEARKLYWRVKTQKNIFDFGIAEELILTDKLDVGKYVKRILLNSYYHKNSNIQEIVKSKYPHIEIIELNKDKGYMDIKKAIKQKEKVLVQN